MDIYQCPLWLETQIAFISHFHKKIKPNCFLSRIPAPVCSTSANILHANVCYYILPLFCLFGECKAQKHALGAVWNIHNNSIILRIPYWLSIACVNAFYHPKLKWFLKEKLRLMLRFLKGKGERFRGKRKKAVDIIIYSFAFLNYCIWKLSFLCH